MKLHHFLCLLLVVMSCVTGCKPRRSADTRKLFDDRRFDDLEKLAVDLRASQSLFRDGSKSASSQG